jgi:hypothetical protein
VAIAPGEHENGRKKVTVEKLLLTRKEVKETIGCGDTFLDGLIKNGRVVAVKQGTAVRVTTDSVREYVEGLKRSAIMAESAVA